MGENSDGVQSRHQPSSPASMPHVSVVPQCIAEEILSHEKESLRLRGALNAHAPINRLPTEVLSLIFLRQAASFQQEQFACFRHRFHDDDDISSHKRLYTWLGVARVCRHWREVALQCAALWRFLAIDERVPGDILKTFVARSQGLPLTIIAHAIHENFHCRACVTAEDAESNREAGLALLEQSIVRATKLKLYVWGVEYEDFWEVLAGPAPKLTSLHLEAVGDATYSAYGGRQHQPDVVVPDLLFGESAPPLRVLSLWGVGLVWSNKLFCATLLRLKVTSCRVFGGMGVLLDALRGMPNLRDLAIDHVSLPRSDPNARFDTVVLPSLQRLHLSMGYKRSLSLASHLRFPRTATVRFTAQGKKPFSEAVLAAYSRGLRHLLDGMHVHAISHQDDYAYESIQLWATAPRPATHSSPSTSPVDPEEDVPWETFAATRPRLRFDCFFKSGIVGAILAGLDLQHLRVLSVCPRLSLGYEWVDAFASADHITTLRIQGQGAFSVGAALVRWKRPAHLEPELDEFMEPVRREDCLTFGQLPDDDPRTEDGYMPGPLVFPSLHTIRIASADFPQESTKREREYLGGDPHMAFSWDFVDGPYGLDVEGLLKSLRVRTKKGATEVTRLEFERSQCWERERLAPLVGAVREVWWDRKRLAPDDLGEQVELQTIRKVRPTRWERIELSDSELSD